MQNNAITIFVDSVVWECIGTTRAKVSPTPFLDSLKKEGVSANNLYSHGPYTDAATRSLLTGRNCLDDYGYYFKLNTAPINHYKLFHDAGYETYDFHYPYYIKGNKVKESIDHSIYFSGFIFGSEWGGLYSYYFEKVKTKPLDDTDYKLIIKRMGYMFESWISYLSDLINIPESRIMMTRVLKEYDYENKYKLLIKEQATFNKSPKDYIDSFLKQGPEHILFSIDNTSMDSYINSSFIGGYIAKKHKNLFRKIAWINFWVNIKAFPSFKRIIKALWKTIKTKNTDNLIFLQNYVLSLVPMYVMKSCWTKPRWKHSHSARTNYETAIDILRERSSEKPFYMFFHVGEPHTSIAFFSFDRDDKNLIDEELKVLNDYVDQLGTKFVGNLVYFLSIRYTDYVIERFCNSLKALGLWDNTSILFVSDHGSSHTYHPLHNRRVNCFDDECYHIPMIIRHPGMQPVEVNSYQYSKDVFPTFAEVLGIPQSPYFKGRSMLSEKEVRSVVVTEYMGPGCPDIHSRRIWFSARDARYIVAYKVGVFENFEDGELAEVYDLNKDKMAYYNINDSIAKESIQYLLDSIKDRFEEIKQDTKQFISQL